MGKPEPPTFESALLAGGQSINSDPPPPYNSALSTIRAPGSGSGPAAHPGPAPSRPSGAPPPDHSLSKIPSPPTQSRLSKLVRSRHSNSAPGPQIAKPRTLEQVFALYPWRRSWGPRPKDLDTALNRAALLGIAHLVTALVDAGAVVTSNEHLATQHVLAVHEALRGPRPDLALLLLRNGLGAANGDPEMVASVLASRDANGATPLHIAAEVGEVELIYHFVEYGAVVDALDNYKRTPLHMAARYGRKEALCCLLDLGADPARVHRGLWDVAGATTTPELGCYALISEALTLALEATQDSGLPSLSSSVPGHVTTSSTASQSIPGHDRGPGVRPRQLSVIESPMLPDHLPMRSYRQSARSDMASAAFVSMYDARTSARRRAPVPGRDFAPTSFRNTPEYAVWSQTCDKLYAEHRAQQQKNLSLDNGGMGFVPSGW